MAVALLAALVVAPAALAAPANDSIALPFNVDLAGGAVTVDSTGAMIEANEPLTAAGPGVCNPNARKMTATTWYRILGNGGLVSINTAGSNFDTVIAVYLVPPSIADGLPCNDDASTTTTTSAVSFQSEAGQAYLIQVGGCDCGAGTLIQGSLQMNVSATDPPPPPTPPAPPPVVITPPDSDSDGIIDANDRCPTVKPTRDANNDGCQDAPIRILSDLKYDGRFIRGGGGVRGLTLSRVRLTRVPAGAVVRVSCGSCRRGGRSFRGFSFTARKTGTQAIGRLSRLQLTRGKQLVVVVTSPDHLGRRVLVRFVGRRDRVTLSCLAAGSRTQRVACSSGS
jgi:hypothetical protein